jgi:hypothetical protein
VLAFNRAVARFSDPRRWIVALEDGRHEVTVGGWAVAIGGPGITRDERGREYVDGEPVPCTRSPARGFVFAYLEHAWHFSIAGHRAVIHQRLVGVPIWDLVVDGRRVDHARMDRQAIIATTAHLLLALLFSLAVAALLVVGVVRLTALLLS